jgi:glutathione peroxidase
MNTSSPTRFTRRRVLATAASLPLAATLLAPRGTWAQTNACPALLNHRFNRLQDDAPQSLCQYAGRVLLVVNTASRCGYTPQYEGLEKLHARFASRGLVVLGFPANNFGAQEPGSNEQIAAFCFNTFGVRFPMFAKSDVIGPQANPLHRTGAPDRPGAALELPQVPDRPPRQHRAELCQRRRARKPDADGSGRARARGLKDGSSGSATRRAPAARGSPRQRSPARQSRST